MNAEKHYGDLLIKQALRNKELRETMKDAVRALENGLSISALRLLRAELGESAKKIGAPIVTDVAHSSAERES